MGNATQNFEGTPLSKLVQPGDMPHDVAGKPFPNLQYCVRCCMPQTQEGLVFDDADPSSVGNLNLALNGLQAAQSVVNGENGFVMETHLRRNVDQINGYAHAKGALGFAGYG